MVTDTIILKVDKSKKKAFLEMLKLFDFIEVENQRDILIRFLQNSPKSIPLTYDDIVAEVMSTRYKR